MSGLGPGPCFYACLNHAIVEEAIIMQLLLAPLSIKTFCSCLIIFLYRPSNSSANEKAGNLDALLIVRSYTVMMLYILLAIELHKKL
jgi:hypothetical protein